MAYNSYTYLFLFMGVTFSLHYIIPKKIRWLVLLLASLSFYFISSGKYIIFPIMTILSIYICGLLLNKIDDKFKLKKSTAEKEQKKILKKKANKQKKALVSFVAVCNILVLAFLKYFNFFSKNVVLLLNKAGADSLDAKILKLILPLGISFYTLQAVSYIVDVYRGTIKADKNLGRVALFICFFPTVVEGPICKYDKLAYQAFEGHSFEMDNFRHGCEMILWGLFKKVVIADRANMFVGAVFNNHADYTGLIIAIATLIYTIQIYFEFSGCMDIVMGSAKIFGINLQKNFNHPMFSKTVNEFWRRWHITLGDWLRNYVFYPLSLSKPVQALGKWSKKHIKGHLGKIVPSIFALFFVWLCNGLWHGASWHYIFYGLYYYVIMTMGTVFEPMFKSLHLKLKINTQTKWYKAFQMFRTFIIVNIGMLFFRADGFKVGLSMFTSMFKNIDFSILWNRTLFHFKLDIFDLSIIAIGVLVVLTVSIIQEKGISISDFVNKQKLPIRWISYLAAVTIIIVFGAYGKGYDPAGFIYAQF